MNRKTGKQWVQEDNKNLKPWRSDAIAEIRRAMQGQSPFRQMVELEAIFAFPRLRSHFGTGRNANVLKENAAHYKDTKPDLDKLMRALKDAITQGGGWTDDALCVRYGAVSKIFADRPSVWFRVTAINPEG